MVRFLPWRRAETQSLLKNLAWLTGGGIVTGLVAYVLGVHKIYPLLTVALAGFNLVSLALLITGAVRPRVRLTGRGTLSVLRSYATENRRRIGSMVVHFGVIVVALGIAGSGGYRVDELLSVPVGGSATFQGYTLTATDKFMDRLPDRISAGAIIEVSRGDHLLATLRPRTNVFTNSPQQQVPTPGVLYRPQHDVYLSVAGPIGPDTTTIPLKAVQSPLIAWIWLGGFIMVLGTAYCLMPQGRREAERRREAVRA